MLALAEAEPAAQDDVVLVAGMAVGTDPIADTGLAELQDLDVA